LETFLNAGTEDGGCANKRKDSFHDRGWPDRGVRSAQLSDAEDEVTEHAVWPVLPLRDQLAPWLPMFIGLAIVVAFVILVVDKVERLRQTGSIEPVTQLALTARQILK
jgi:hypothetical protein